MGDHGQFSDDISALWGPSDTGALEPAPLRKPEPESPNGLTNGATATNGAVHQAPAAVHQRLTALERQLQDLTDKVGRDHPERVTRGDLDALRTDLEDNLGQEVAQARRDLVAQNHVLDRLEQRLIQLSELVETHRAHAERAPDPQPDPKTNSGPWGHIWPRRPAPGS